MSIDLRPLDDIPLQDRWGDIQVRAVETPTPAEPELIARRRYRIVMAAALVVALVGAVGLSFRDSDGSVRVATEEPTTVYAFDGIITSGPISIEGSTLYYGSPSLTFPGETTITAMDLNDPERRSSASAMGGLLTSIASTSEWVVAVDDAGSWLSWKTSNLRDADAASSNEHGKAPAIQVAEGGGQFWILLTDDTLIHYWPDEPNVEGPFPGPENVTHLVVSDDGVPWVATEQGVIARDGVAVANYGAAVLGLVPLQDTVLVVTADQIDGELQHVTVEGRSGTSFGVVDLGAGPVAWAKGPQDRDVVVLYESGLIAVAQLDLSPVGAFSIFGRGTNVTSVLQASATAQLDRGQLVLVVADVDGVLEGIQVPEEEP